MCDLWKIVSNLILCKSLILPNDYICYFIMKLYYSDYILKYYDYITI